MNDSSCDPTFDPSFYRSDFFSNSELDEHLPNLLPFESTEFSGWTPTLSDTSAVVAPIIRDLPLNNWAAASDFPVMSHQTLSVPNLIITPNFPVCAAADSSTPKNVQPKKRKPTKPKSASDDLITVSSNEMNELLDDHRNVELRKKQKRDYARKKRAFERTLREKFPVMEAELAALQKQNEQLKAQLSQNATQVPAADSHLKLDSAVKQLASMGFNLNNNFSNGVVTKKTKKPKRKSAKMETGSSSPSSSSSSDDEGSSDAPRVTTSQDILRAMSGVSHLLEETHVSAESQLTGLQQVIDSPAVRALNLLSSQLAIATKDSGNINALNSHAADQAVMAMRSAHAQFMVALREHAAIAQRSFSHLSNSMAPEQLVRCLQGVPLQ